MKKVILVFLFSAVIVSCAQIVSQAKTYVLKDKVSNEVFAISDSNNIVNNTLEAEIVVLEKDLEYYNLEEAHTDYLLKNKKFVLNTYKISEKEDKKNQDKEKKIKDSSFKISITEKLKVLGFTDYECEYLVR